MRIARTVVPVIAASLTLISCFNDKLDPVAPTWDIDMTAPLANRQYTVMDLARKQPGLIIPGTGNQLVFHTSVVAPGDSVGDRLSLNPVPQRRNVRVGVFSIDSDSATANYQFPFLPPGSTVPAIPDTTVSAPDIQSSFSEFQSATFESGTITMTIRNNIPDTVGLVNDLVLSDGTGTFATFAFAGVTLRQRDSVSRTASLANKTVHTPVKLSGATFHLFRKTTSSTMPNGPLIHGSVSMTSLRAHSAVLAYISPQQLTNNDTTFLTLNDSTIVKEVVFGSGTLNFNVSSNIPMDMDVTARFPEVLQPAGGGYITYVRSTSFFQGNSSFPLQVALKGLRIHSLDGDLVRSLQLVSSLYLHGSTTPITLHDTDKVTINMTSDGKVAADSAVAVVKPTWINVQRSVPLSLGDLSSKFAGTITIPSANLRLNTLSTVGCPADLYVQLQIVNPTTKSVLQLPVPPAQRRVRYGNGTIVFDPTAVGGFLSAASPKFPDSISISGSVLVNPPDLYNPTIGGVATIARASFVRDTVVADIPFNLSVVGGVFRDTASVEPFDSKEANKMNIGTLHIEVQNGLPTRARARVVLLDSSHTALLTIPQSGLPIDLSPAPVNGQGLVSASVPTSVAITLTGSDIQKFSRVKFTAIEVDVDTTPGSPVQFRTSDVVLVRVWATLSYRVSK